MAQQQMENAVATVETGNMLALLQATPPMDMGQMGDFLGAGYVPRIQVMDYQTGQVKDELIRAGNIGIILDKQTVIDLGSSASLLLLSWRCKALDMNEEPPVTSYDRNSDLFKIIASKASDPDAKCLAGLEFLCWNFEKERFVVFYPAGKSARSQAQPCCMEFKKFQEGTGPGLVTLTGKKIEKGTYKWFAPVISTCQVTCTPYPSGVAVKTELDKFLNPKDEVSEVASTDGQER